MKNRLRIEELFKAKSKNKNALILSTVFWIDSLCMELEIWAIIMICFFLCYSWLKIERQRKSSDEIAQTSTARSCLVTKTKRRAVGRRKDATDVLDVHCVTCGILPTKKRRDYSVVFTCAYKQRPAYTRTQRCFVGLYHYSPTHNNRGGVIYGFWIFWGQFWIFEPK